MDASIFNKNRERVERLEFTGILFYLGNGATTNTITITLQDYRMYNIKRIRLQLGLFFNDETNVYAYPNFEQFYGLTQIDIKVTSDKYYIINNFRTLTNDGNNHSFEFQEPFIFQSRENDSLTIDLNGQGVGRYAEITNYWATPSANVQISGVLILEGTSQPINIGQQLTDQKVNEQMASAGIDEDNLIDIPAVNDLPDVRMFLKNTKPGFSLYSY